MPIARGPFSGEGSDEVQSDGLHTSPYYSNSACQFPLEEEPYELEASDELDASNEEEDEDELDDAEQTLSAALQGDAAHQSALDALFDGDPRAGGDGSGDGRGAAPRGAFGQISKPRQAEPKQEKS